MPTTPNVSTTAPVPLASRPPTADGTARRET